VYFGTFIGLENESLEAIIEFTKEKESRDVLSLNEPIVEGYSRTGILNISGSITVEMNIYNILI
jgi:N-acyl-phosphatidylethanolamine-hydrolysing phospholipase D